MKNKLENPRVIDLLAGNVIICLNEIKTSEPFNVPGYKTYTSGGAARHRGGCGVLVKNHLVKKLISMDTVIQI